MRRFLSLLGATVLVISLSGWGQLWSGFNAYPGGHLLMVYHIGLQGGEEYTYTLELTPVPGSEGRYTIRTEIVGEGTLDDVQGSPYLFFAWEPSVWFGNAWWLSLYLSVFMPGQELVPHRTYILPGGIRFEAEEYVEIAGIRAVQGTFTMPQSPDERLIMAISPDPAVPYPVLIRDETNTGGVWEPLYEIVLVKYEHK